MQLVMERTYPLVPIIAIEQGTIEGAWEKAIAERLQKDNEAGSKLPYAVLLELGLPFDWPVDSSVWLRAAHLITNKTEL